MDIVAQGCGRLGLQGEVGQHMHMVYVDPTMCITYQNDVPQ